MTSHALKIRCPTWDHLETFCQRKIKEDNTLVARVPFPARDDEEVQISVELPDATVVVIQSVVARSRDSSDGKRIVEMRLGNYEGATRDKLLAAIEAGREAEGFYERRTETGLPVPLPTDAPIDEVVRRPYMPSAEQLQGRERQEFEKLEARKRELEEQSTHGVLGVGKDASIEEIRQAYFARVKEFHPDGFASQHSMALSMLSSEILIHVNLAYDRLRMAAVEQGRAIVAGPSLLPHEGWLASLEDLEEAPSVAIAVQPVESEAQTVASQEFEGVQVGASAPPPLAPLQQPARGLDTESLFVDARQTQAGLKPIVDDDDVPPPQSASQEMLTATLEGAKSKLEQGDFDSARSDSVEILERDPRNRHARALVHLCTAYQLLAEEKAIEALNQIEVALRHDPELKFALELKKKMENASEGRRRRPSFLRRLFSR